MTQPAILTRDTLGSAPATEPLPDGFELEVASISATFNGAAASGSFYACCSFYAQNGALIGRFFPSQVLASGDSGEVTYGPF